MLSNEALLITGYPRQTARFLYVSILYPQQWEMGPAEAQSLELSRDRWHPRETYWLYQPSLQEVLW